MVVGAKPVCQAGVPHVVGGTHALGATRWWLFLLTSDSQECPQCRGQYLQALLFGLPLHTECQPIPGQGASVVSRGHPFPHAQLYPHSPIPALACLPCPPPATCRHGLCPHMGSGLQS